MGCNCNKAKRAGGPQRFELVLPAGTTFDDGTNRRTFETKGEAVAAKKAMGGVGTIRPVKT